MHFDLIDAMKKMNDEFGDDGEILLLNYENKILVRLRVIDCELYSSQFAIDNEDLINRNASKFNYMFQYSIDELKMAMKDNKGR